MKNSTQRFLQWAFPCFLSLIAGGSTLQAVTYYVSTSGNDLNPGTTTAQPWKTLSKINGTSFSAGDTILFKCGETFTAPTNSDALIVNGTGTKSGSVVTPLTYGSYSVPGGSTARPIIYQPKENAYVMNQLTGGKNGVKLTGSNDWVVIQDLEIVGPHDWHAAPPVAGSGVLPGNMTPYGIHLQGSSGNILTGTTIKNVVVRNFAGSGIRSNTGERLANTRIEYTEVYQVGDAGIRLGSDTDTQDGEIRTDLYVGHCYVHHTSGFDAGSGNHNGDGIQIACAKNVTVEYCVVHNAASAFQGGAGGPVGIWFADVHNGVIQFNEAYSNTNGVSSSDGGGIDLDGGCLDCVAQYNYTHDNEGAGFLLAHWGSSTGAYCSPTERNTFRYNISVNDSRSTPQGALAVWSAGGAGTCQDTRFYNNLVIETKASRSDPCFSLLTSTAASAARPVQVYNNIFITANGHKLTNTISKPNALVKKNIWWSLDNNFIYLNGSTPSTLAASDPEGLQVDPMIADAVAIYNAPVIGFAKIDQMARLLAPQYKLLSGSPAIDVGRDKDLQDATIPVGTRDFFGNAIPSPVGGTYDIGAHEMAAASGGRIGFTSSILSGAEGDTLTVTLRRSGGAVGAVSAVVTSADGLAQGGSDFPVVNTTINWPNGDTTDKTFTILLNDDSAVEGDENFSLLLSNVTGAEMVGTGVAYATIRENDFATAANYTNRLNIAGSDPFITPGGDGKFYMYISDGDGTTTAPSRLESTDLVNWSNKQSIYSDLAAQAPHVIFEPLGRQWWYFGNSETASAPLPTGIFSKVSDNWGTSPWHFTDPVSGKAYMYTGGTGGSRHRIDLLDNPNYVNQTVYPYFIDAWWGANWEGGTIIKNGSTYYWFMSMNSAGRSVYRLAYATAPSPEGPWTMQTQEDSAAILRQSDVENIWGPGSSTIFTDAKGTNWLYYQQKEATSTSIVLTDRYIAMDPIWFDSTGIPHVRPTRGTARPGPNSLPSLIWPTVSAASTIEAESYAGSTIVTLAAGGTGPATANLVSTIRNQSYLAYRNVDFGAGLAGIEARFASGVTDAGVIGSIEVHVDGVNGPLVGVLPFSKTAGFTTFSTISGGLYQTVTGVKDVFLVFHGLRPGTELMRLDWFKFVASGTANTNHPPVANPDTFSCAMGGQATFNLLTNDSDPDAGNTLTISGVSNATVLNRSFKGTTSNVSIGSGGLITYNAPSPTFWGDDVFFYTVKDSAGGYKTGTVKVKVYPGSSLKQESGGLAVIEAEDYNDSQLNADTNGAWVVATSVAGFKGTGYITTADNGTSPSSNTAYVDYAVDIQTPGVYTVWARCSQPDANGNQSQISFTTNPTGSNPDRIAGAFDSTTQSGWYWIKMPELRSLRPGVQRMRVNRQKDGHRIDQFILAADPNYDPAVTIGTVALASGTLSVSEGASSAILNVSRSGSTSGAVSVGYTTTSGTASAGSDFTTTSGTLNWISGDSADKTITVPLVNDAVTESDETFTVTLSGPVGATLGSPASTVVTIQDNDAGFSGWSGNIAWNGGDSSAGGDADGDGMSNLLEYALGGNPVQSSSGLGPVVDPSPDNTRLEITFNRDSSLTTLTYEVQAVSDLNGTWTTIASSVNGAAFTNVSGGSFSVVETGAGTIKSVTVTDGTLISAGPKRFLRLRVTEAP